MTILDALNAAALAGNIPFRFAIENNHTKLLAFNGLVKGKQGIQIVLNDQIIDETQINTMPVQPLDRIMIKMRR
jgi:hypothetical protein